MSQESDDHRTNGYVRLTTLVMVAVPLLTIFAGAVSLFVSMSIAPMQKQLDALHEDNTSIHQDLVPRKEHDRDWQAQDARFSDLQRQIDENKADIKSIYTPSDAIHRLETRLDQLQSQMQEHPQH